MQAPREKITAAGSVVMEGRVKITVRILHGDLCFAVLGENITNHSKSTEFINHCSFTTSTKYSYCLVGGLTKVLCIVFLACG